MNAIKKKFGTIGFEVKCFWKEKKGWCKSKYILLEFTSFHVNGPKYESGTCYRREIWLWNEKKIKLASSFQTFFIKYIKSNY